MCLFKHFLHVLFILTINVWQLQKVLNYAFVNMLIIFHFKTKLLYMHKKHVVTLSLSGHYPSVMELEAVRVMQDLSILGRFLCLLKGCYGE